MIRPNGFIPTRILDAPFFKSSLIFSQPLNPPSSLLLFEMAHFKFAWMGLIFSLRSCPYKQSPASNLKVSLAPRPIGLTPFSTKSFVKLSAFEFVIETSNPSSPVYPERVI